MNINWVSFRYTNESLDAIVRGMAVNETDDIIAICGSGDQAFAMLEYAKSVVAIDNDRRQIEYAIERAAMIKGGDFEKLFEAPCNRNKKDKLMSIAYFSQPGRLERIRQNINRLEIRHVNSIFIGEVEEGRFTKIFLSNIMGFHGFLPYSEEQQYFIAEIAARLRMPGLMYFSDEKKLCSLAELKDIVRDDVLSNIAREEEDKAYSPEKGFRVAVYRRVE